MVSHRGLAVVAARAVVVGSRAAPAALRRIYDPPSSSRQCFMTIHTCGSCCASNSNMNLTSDTGTSCGYFDYA